MAGVLASEVFLVRALGIQGAGWCAAAAFLAASAAAAAVLRAGKRPLSHDTPRVNRRDRRSIAPLVLSFSAGAAFLSLEVAWFRFFTLFFHSLSLNFAILLAVLLAGTWCGSIAGGFLARRSCPRYAGWYACLCAVLVSVLYRAMPALFDMPVFSQVSNTASLVFLSALFIFPVAAASGMYFIQLSKQVREFSSDDGSGSGMIMTANTAGCCAGALTGGLVLIPAFGVEKTIWLCACVYAVCGIAGIRPRRLKPLVGCFVTIAALAAFPFGIMREELLKIPVAPFWEPGMKRVQVTEGAQETIQLMRQSLAGRPYYHYLITNSYSMSSTSSLNRRYMYYFSFLPLAVKPDLRRALVISYGLGNTADALCDEPRLERLDVVDVSPDIYATSSGMYASLGSRDPLKDPRVKAYAEDARFFLLTRASSTYDLVTGEPPPPKIDGVVNLYTREFFSLIRERLNPGGMVTYWLPVSQLKPDETKAIVAAFRQVFPDCMLFAPVPADWVMVGTRDWKKKSAPVNEFKRLWFNDRMRDKLYRTGFMTPDQLVALFVIDGKRLAAWLGSQAPLEDNYPRRLSSEMAAGIDPEISLLLSGQRSRGAFLQSETVKKLFCQDIRWAAKRVFKVRDYLYRAMQGYEDTQYIGVVHACIEEPLLQEALLWALGSDYDALAITTGALKNGEEVSLSDAGLHWAARSVFEKDYARAESLYARLSRGNTPGKNEFWYALRIYLLHAAGNPERAHEVVNEYIAGARGERDAARRARNAAGLEKWLEAVFKEKV
jgi:spermidine synthase